MSSKNNIESILSREGFYLFTGNGSSMWPLIRGGIDTVEVRPVSAPLKRGDVILYNDGEKYILHRIFDAGNATLITHGDNTGLNETVPPERIVGVMSGLWRGNKKINLGGWKYRLYTHLCLNRPLLFRILKSRIIWR